MQSRVHPLLVFIKADPMMWCVPTKAPAKGLCVPNSVWLELVWSFTMKKQVLLTLLPACMQIWMDACKHTTFAAV